MDHVANLGRVTVGDNSVYCRGPWPLQYRDQLRGLYMGIHMAAGHAEGSDGLDAQSWTVHKRLFIVVLYLAICYRYARMHTNLHGGSTGTERTARTRGLGGQAAGSSRRTGLVQTAYCGLTAYWGSDRSTMGGMHCMRSSVWNPGFPPAQVVSCHV